ncbi:MAG: hypothetical protein FWH32_06980 [Clostridiales bacterium]|nr:hypothetical protein [Clostridiales bacterium]
MMLSNGGKMVYRLLAWSLSLCLAFTMVPLSAGAAFGASAGGDEGESGGDWIASSSTAPRNDGGGTAEAMPEGEEGSEGSGGAEPGFGEGEGGDGEGEGGDPLDDGEGEKGDGDEPFDGEDEGVTPMGDDDVRLLAMADVESFQFEVTVTGTTETALTFRIPLSGGLNPNGGADSSWNKPYNWNIDWGDGSGTQTVASTDLDVEVNSSTSGGIPHTYGASGTYTIEITPAGNEEAWLAAFGFYIGTSGANATANKNRLTRVLSPLTPLMTRTQAQIDGGADPPSIEWSYTFYNCANLAMGDEFAFSDGWGSIDAVGHSFMQSMFEGCSGGGFAVNNVFTLPALDSVNLNRPAVFHRVFYNLGGNPAQTRRAASIIGGNAVPDANRQTFSGSTGFIDLPYIHARWGGGGTDAENVLIADISSKSFSSRDLGYTDVETQTVTVYNFGSSPITDFDVALEHGDSFVVEPPLETTIPLYGSLTFDMRPAMDLDGGRHEDTVVLTASGKEPLRIPVSFHVIAPESNIFQFEVTVTGTSTAARTFRIPLSGQLNPDGGTAAVYSKPYDWNIDWGDGSPNERVYWYSSSNRSPGAAANASSNTGIPRTYAAAGTYTITITPAGSDQAWLAAFGFTNSTMGSANATNNKNMVTRVISPITPLMTRTQAQIDGIAPPPSFEWTRTFYRCRNLVMGEGFNFSDEWDAITRVGDGFASSMFYDCNGAAFTMNDVFTLPQNVTTVGNDFARFMFWGCNGAAFTMNGVFNLPQNINVAGNYFASAMFLGCNGDGFTMNGVFNMPPKIGIVGTYFAVYMFQNCNGGGFSVNDVFRFPTLNSANLNRTRVFYRTFYNLGSTPPQARTADSIIAGNDVPSDNRQTFTNSACFSDLQYVHTRWGGGGFNANHMVATPSAVGFPYEPPGYAPVDPREITIRNNFSAAISGVSVALAAGSAFELGALSDTTIPPGGSVNFSVNPVDGLARGMHTDTIIVSAASRGSVRIPVSFGVLPPGENVFQFEVTVTGTTETERIFRIPLSGMLNPAGGTSATYSKPYDWNIDWGDGSPIERVYWYSNANRSPGAVSNSSSSAGIPRTYATAGTYTITITPAGVEDAWLAAFGFRNTTAGRANSNVNKNMVTKVISPLTPLMTRTLAQTVGSAVPPSFEWAYTFYRCANLSMEDSFNFSDEWESVTSVGHNFAQAMFYLCFGTAFTMNDVFNLPQGITTVGNYFAQNMFQSCYGINFTMNDVFNLPQGITTVGNYFAQNMFRASNGGSFTMGAAFNLPQNIVVAGEYFANSMFYGCNGGSFTMNKVFNLPPGIGTVGRNFATSMFQNCSGPRFMANDVFRFPTLDSTNLNRTSVFASTFRGLGTATSQRRSASSIIGGNALPRSSKSTFTSSGCFSDLTYIPSQWGGSGRNANNVLIASHRAVTFPDRASGSAPASTQAITVYNRGTVAINGFVAALSGGGGFVVEGLVGTSIPAGGSLSFDVATETSMAPGLYTDTLVLSATSCASVRVPLFLSVVPPEGEHFQFEVSVAGASVAERSFIIPLSGRLGDAYGKAYEWTVDWGDGEIEHIDSSEGGAPQNAADSDGIEHVYDEAGTYVVTIMPAGSEDAWLGAFGFGTTGAGAANSQDNKDKIRMVHSPLSPLMTRTEAQIDGDVAPPLYEWAYTFNDCINMNMGPDFAFARGWDGIDAVGDGFAEYMFLDVSGPAFNMNRVFNLPAGITEVGEGFAYGMFAGCGGDAFTMNGVFNLPRGIASVGDWFAASMFEECGGEAFAMNGAFNLPAGIASVGNGFAASMFAGADGDAFTMNGRFNLPVGITSVGYQFAAYMFEGADGAAFNMNSVFNLPAGIENVGEGFIEHMFDNVGGGSFQVNGVFEFPVLAPAELNKPRVFYRTFHSIGDTYPQARTAISIISGNPVPAAGVDTFMGSGRFRDLAYIPVNWGGGGGSLDDTLFVSHSTIDFPVKVEGYAERDVRIVSVHNFGGTEIQGVTVSLAGGAGFELGALSAENIPAGGSVSFALEPRLGLAVGEYRGIASVGATGCDSVDIVLSFAVVGPFIQLHPSHTILTKDKPAAVIETVGIVDAFFDFEAVEWSVDPESSSEARTYATERVGMDYVVKQGDSQILVFTPSARGRNLSVRAADAWIHTASAQTLRIRADYDGRYMATATVEMIPDATLPGTGSAFATTVTVLETSIAVNRAQIQGTLVPIRITQQRHADGIWALGAGAGAGGLQEMDVDDPALPVIGAMRFVRVKVLRDGGLVIGDPEPGYSARLWPEDNRFIEVMATDTAKSRKNVILQIQRAGAPNWTTANQVNVTSTVLNLSVSTKYPSVRIRPDQLNRAYPTLPAKVNATSSAGSVRVLDIDSSTAAFQSRIAFDSDAGEVNLKLQPGTEGTIQPLPVVTKNGTQKGRARVQVEGFYPNPKLVALNVRVVNSHPSIRLDRGTVALHHPQSGTIESLPDVNADGLAKGDFVPAVVNIVSGTRNRAFQDGYMVKRVTLNPDHAPSMAAPLVVSYMGGGRIELHPTGPVIPKTVQLRVFFDDPAFDNQVDPNSYTKFVRLNLKVTMRAENALNVTNKSTAVAVNRDHVAEGTGEYVIRDIPIGLNAANLFIEDWKVQGPVGETTKTRTDWQNTTDPSLAGRPPVRVVPYVEVDDSWGTGDRRSGIRLVADRDALRDLMERGRSASSGNFRNLRYRMNIGSDKVKDRNGNPRVFAVNLTFTANASSFRLSLNSRTRIDVANPESFQTATVRLTNTTSEIDYVLLYPTIPNNAQRVHESRDFVAEVTGPLTFNIVKHPDNDEVVPGVTQRLSVRIVLKNGQEMRSWTDLNSKMRNSDRTISVNPRHAVGKATSRTVTLYRRQPLQGAGFEAAIRTPANVALGVAIIDQNSLNNIRFAKPVISGTSVTGSVKYGGEPGLHGGLVLERNGSDGFVMYFEDGIAPSGVFNSKGTLANLKANYTVRVELWAAGTYALARDEHGTLLRDAKGNTMPMIGGNGKVEPLRDERGKARSKATVYNVRVNIR